MTHTLITSDLDQTLIFSRNASDRLGGALPDAVVETIDDRVISTMASAVSEGLGALGGDVTFVPSTTRTAAQLLRVALPVPYRFAIAASGGVVLRDGKQDPEWATLTEANLRTVAPLADARGVLERLVSAGDMLRSYDADGIFCYGIVDPVTYEEDTHDALIDAVATLGWRVSRLGRKVYLLPNSLHKAQAVAYVRSLVTASVGEEAVLFAAGDTSLDWEMLLAADRGWVPAGSELAEGAWRAPHVTITQGRGHSAAAEIVAEWTVLTGNRAQAG